MYIIKLYTSYMADSDIWNRLCAFADKEKNNE